MNNTWKFVAKDRTDLINFFETMPVFKEGGIWVSPNVGAFEVALTDIYLKAKFFGFEDKITSIKDRLINIEPEDSLHEVDKEFDIFRPLPDPNVGDMVLVYNNSSYEWEQEPARFHSRNQNGSINVFAGSYEGMVVIKTYKTWSFIS